MDKNKLEPQMPESPGLESARNELGSLLAEAADKKSQLVRLEAEEEVLKGALKNVSDIILKTLDLLQIDSIKGHGFLFFKENRTSVTTPKTPEEKKQLFDFLEAEGIFLEMASVNSQTLNSLYKEYESKALKDGKLEFKMPGVAEPTTYINLKMKKA